MSTAAAVEAARVRCASCHRVERWSDGAVHVELPGGSRQPAQGPEATAFAAYAAWKRSEAGPLVGACDGCGQPLVLTEGTAEPVEWVVGHPDGDLLLTPGGVRCGDTDVPLDDAELRVRAAYPAWSQWSRSDVVANGFLTGVLPFLLLPLVLWASAVSVVVVFYSHWASGGGSVGMP